MQLLKHAQPSLFLFRILISREEEDEKATNNIAKVILTTINHLSHFGLQYTTKGGGQIDFSIHFLQVQYLIYVTAYVSIYTLVLMAGDRYVDDQWSLTIG